MPTQQPLALHGGPKTVTIDYTERWPLIGEDEVNAVVQLMLAGQLSIKDGSGILHEFESKFAGYHNVPYALVQNNGTSTLHAAFFAVGVGPGDEVIVPTYTWPSTANAVVSCNATPVFCDIDPRTLCLDPANVERRLTPATRAIAVVHIWGHPVDMDPILAIARQHNLKVIEDVSHAHGATYKGRRLGTLGDIGCFSLQASKMVVGGEAGVAITANPEYYDRMLALAHYGGRIETGSAGDTYQDYAYTGLGPKYRAHPLAVAIANAQLDHLDEWIAQRRANLDYLTAGLAGIPGLEPPYTAPDSTRGAYYGYRIVYRPEQFGGLPAARFMEALRAEGVEAAAEYYRLLHRQAFYQGADVYERTTGYRWPYAPIRQIDYSDSEFPVAVQIIDNLVCLPTFTRPGHDLLDQYIAAFHKVAAQAGQI